MFEVLERASRLTNKPILLRLDGGNDAIENVDTVLEFNETLPKAAIDFIIKWNPRKKETDHWLTIAEKQALWTIPRPGKRVGIFSVMVERHWKGYDYKIRRVMRVVERTIDKQGQCLVIPEIEVEGWWTSLWDSPEDIIDIYADHGTSE